MLLPGACGSVPPAVTITRRAPRFNHATACHLKHPGCWSLPSVSRLTSSPPWAPPAVARSAWLFEKVTVVHRTGRNGVRSIARLALLRSSLRDRSATLTCCLRMPRYRRISYRLIFSYNVERSMPRATAASFTFPLLRSSAASIISFSISSSVASGGVQL